VNEDVGAVTDPADLWYRLVSHSEGTYGSADQFVEIELGWKDTVDEFDGHDLYVTYDTISSFTAVDSYVRSEDNRPGAGGLLVKGHHPLHLYFTVSLRLLSGRLFPAADELILKQHLVEYIEAFNAESVLSTSGLATEIKSYCVAQDLGEVKAGAHSSSAGASVVSSAVAAIGYTLYAPDGRLVSYATVDKVEISEDRHLYADPLTRLVNPAAHGVSDRTTRYLVSVDDITIVVL